MPIFTFFFSSSKPNRFQMLNSEFSEGSDHTQILHDPCVLTDTTEQPLGHPPRVSTGKGGGAPMQGSQEATSS